MSQDYYFKSTCRLCESSSLEKVIELTPTPPGNNFLRADELGQPEPEYPIEAYFCRDCFHVQLGHVVDPKILFRSNYSYVSGTSAVFVKHLADYAREMVRRYEIRPGSLVADIGSNDGTCLKFFREEGMRVVGIDPAADIAKIANDKGIDTVVDFFGRACAERMRAERGPAAFITSHNACAHIDDLAGVMEGVAHWLADDGLFGVEVGYLYDVTRNNYFDTIYHEHLDFHSVAPFRKFFTRHGLELIHAERVAPQGGSIRLIAQKAGGSRQPDKSVEELIELERDAGLHEAQTFKEFNERINAVGRDLSSLVRGLKAEGKSIAAFGAPTKSTTLLTHFNLGEGILDFIADESRIKQGLFSPKFHIPIVHPDEIYRRRPDYLLLLAWNFADDIMRRYSRYREEGGRFILPMPQARLVE